MSDVPQGQVPHSRDNALRGDQQARHSQCTDTVCGCCIDDVAYPNYTTAYHYGQLKPKDLIGIPWRVAFALQADGWWLRSDIIWAKPNPMPESVTDRPTKAHEYLFLLTKSPRYFYDAQAIAEPLQQSTIDRYQYGWNGVNDDNSNGARTGSAWAKMKNGATMAEAMGGGSTRNRRSVWTVATEPTGFSHFATMPTALVEPCILAGTSAKGVCPTCGAPWERVVEVVKGIPDSFRGSTFTKGKTHDARSPLSAVGQGERTMSKETIGWQPTCTCGGEPVAATVLDPFAGSGTTLAVAQSLGRNSIGIELNPSYIELAHRRILAEQPALFGI